MKIIAIFVGLFLIFCSGLAVEKEAREFNNRLDSLLKAKK